MTSSLAEASPVKVGRTVRRLRIGPLALTLPAGLAMLIFFITPLIVFAFYSLLTAGFFSASGPLTLENYHQALTSDINRTLAQNSLVIGLLAAVTCVILALPIAYWLRYVAGRRRALVLFLITASMFASYLVRIYAWRTILGDNGMLNRALESLGIIHQPLGFLLFNRFAVVIAMVQILLPYVVLVLFAGFGPLSLDLLESAQDLGATALQRWRRVLLPLIAAPAATTFVFVFVLAASDYVTPQLLGGTNGVMLGVQIQSQFLALGNWPLGAATSFLMLIAFVLCFLLTALGLRLLRLDRIRWG